MKRPGHLWLLGLSGSGKSTLGPLLAQKLRLPFQDTDQIICEQAALTIPEIFSREGETGFRQREAAVIHHMVEEKTSVIACGGGAVLDARNRAVMQKTGTRIYLCVPPHILEGRLQLKQDRPLLAQGNLSATLTRQLAERESLYRESEILIEAGAASPTEVVENIFQRLPPLA